MILMVVLNLLPPARVREGPACALISTICGRQEIAVHGGRSLVGDEANRDDQADATAIGRRTLSQPGAAASRALDLSDIGERSERSAVLATFAAVLAGRRRDSGEPLPSHDRADRPWFTRDQISALLRTCPAGPGT
jgi:hypothetical protein